MQTIAIIGGGFCGSVAAVNLMRLSEGPLRVALVNRGFPVGRGVAYGTRRPEHLLNVAARNMSALADHPNHFLEWLRTRSEYAEMPEAVLRETFIPRRVYGDYLRALLQWHAQPIRDRSATAIEFYDKEAVNVVVGESGAKVELADGESIAADKVLLATGNQPPAEVTRDGVPFVHPAYVDLPWGYWENRLPDRHENVVLLGTGLTTVDAFLTLSALDWRGTIFAVSRNGLLPHAHFRGIEYPDFPPEDPTSLNLQELAALIDEHCGRLRGLGAHPAIVVDKLRPHTQRIWQSWSLADKRTFCQRYAARWNVHRHRIAQEVHQRVTAALADGRLQIVTGTIVTLSSAGSRIRVTVAGTSGANVVLEAGFVINGTGPRTSFSAAASPLYRNLLATGQVVVDELDMGIRVDEDFAILERNGLRSRVLYAVGPPIKGTLWETTAVPELRQQTLRVAQTMLEECGLSEPAPRTWSVYDQDLLEYCI